MSGKTKYSTPEGTITIEEFEGEFRPYGFATNDILSPNGMYTLVYYVSFGAMLYGLAIFVMVAMQVLNFNPILDASVLYGLYLGVFCVYTILFGLCLLTTLYSIFKRRTGGPTWECTDLNHGHATEHKKGHRVEVCWECNNILGRKVHQERWIFVNAMSIIFFLLFAASGFLYGGAYVVYRDRNNDPAAFAVSYLNGGFAGSPYLTTSGTMDTVIFVGTGLYYCLLYILMAVAYWIFVAWATKKANDLHNHVEQLKHNAITGGK